MQFYLTPHWLSFCLLAYKYFKLTRRFGVIYDFVGLNKTITVWEKERKREREREEIFNGYGHKPEV
jgi:hypothetical protein